MRAWFAGLALAAAALAAGEARAQARPECEVGAAVLAGFLPAWAKTPPVISPGPQGFLEVHPGPAFSGGKAAEVPPELAKAWGKGQRPNLFDACPELKARLPAGARFATPEEEHDLHRPQIQLLGAPLVQSDRALVFMGYVCGGLCGGYRVELWRREHGTWRQAGVAAVAVS